MSVLFILGLIAAFGGIAWGIKSAGTNSFEETFHSKHGAQVKLNGASVNPMELDAVLDYWVECMQRYVHCERKVLETILSKAKITFVKDDLYSQGLKVAGYVDFKSQLIHIWLPGSFSLVQSSVFHELLHIWFLKVDKDYDIGHKNELWKEIGIWIQTYK